MRRSRKNLITCIGAKAAFVTLLVAWMTLASASAAAQETVASSAIAIVVHKDTDVDNLSLHVESEAHYPACPCAEI
jgi:hypothetical protein